MFDVSMCSPFFVSTKVARGTQRKKILSTKVARGARRVNVANIVLCDNNYYMHV